MRRIAAGARMHRIQRTIHDPIFFGPARAKPQLRYDAPDGSYKILYLARSLETAFGETLVRTQPVAYVMSSAVVLRAYSDLVTTRSVRLNPLLDAGVSPHDLSFSDLHGDAYRKTWAINGLSTRLRMPTAFSTHQGSTISHASRCSTAPRTRLPRRMSLARPHTGAGDTTGRTFWK